MGNKAEAPGQISARLLDEVEQLRTSLESALEENARLMEDRDRLGRRVTQLSQDLQAARSAPPPAPPPCRPSNRDRPKRSCASPSRNCRS